jgi:very-short-patch-repair endonuclease
MDKVNKYINIPEYVTKLSRDMRSNPTQCEEMVWNVLRNKNFFGLKFRRQYPVDRYIVDFYNHYYKLIIEIDGDSHNNKRKYDKNRNDYLVVSGYRVIRFTNEQVEENIEYIIRSLHDWISTMGCCPKKESREKTIQDHIKNDVC